MAYKLSASFMFLITANFLAVAAEEIPHICSDNINYTTSSIYRANLDLLLSSLASNIDSSSGFYSDSVGEFPNRVNSMVLCRGDVEFHACQTCIRNATGLLPVLCPIQKQGTLWYDECMLRYSNMEIVGTIANVPYWRKWKWAPVWNPTQFQEVLFTLLDDLRMKAVGNVSPRKVAAGNMSHAGSQTVFALVQCSPDIQSDDCNTCLNNATGYLPECCYNKTGAAVFLGSCFIEYDTYFFFNESKLESLEEPAPVPQSPRVAGNHGFNKVRVILIVVGSITTCLITVVFVGILLRKRCRSKKTDKCEGGEDHIITVESLQYDFSTIRVATKNFSAEKKLGQGGFGTVYRGVLPEGQEIAVKRSFKNSIEGVEAFKNEVSLLAQLQHKNLVRLLGFSIQEAEKLLVYEFVPNGSLDRFIYDPKNHLDWNVRYKIIQGVAKGLLYLHEDSRLTIIHRDLKASNILLDKQINPKIADFGLARLFGEDKTHGTTSKMAGTCGYMPPEYTSYGYLSIKFDVFSFGVLLLEIISGRRRNMGSEEDVMDLITYALRNWRDGTQENIVDPVLRSLSSEFMDDMLKCIGVGFLCVEEKAADRPTMSAVGGMLNNLNSTALMNPSQTAYQFWLDCGWGVASHGSSEACSSSRSVGPSSRNSINITAQSSGR